jgi:sugar lactone lactonase YvrE
LQNGIYRISEGKTTLVLSGADLGGTPNGIALSPDGKWMYLSTANRQMRRYAVKSDGTLGSFTVFTEGVGIGDGEKTDMAGNVFSTGGSGPVWGTSRRCSPGYSGSIRCCRIRFRAWLFWTGNKRKYLM